MKRCPVCGEMLLEMFDRCPVCGYEFSENDGGIVENGGDLLERNMVEPLGEGRAVEGVLEYSIPVTLEVEVSDYVSPAFYSLVPLMTCRFINRTSEDYVVDFFARIVGFTEKYEKTIEVPASSNREIDVRPSFKMHAFRKLSNQKRTLVKYGYRCDGRRWVDTREIVVLSYRDMLWDVGGRDLSPLIIVWITPNDVWVEDLLRRAVDEMRRRHNEGGIMGYQGGDKRVWMQVEGIYNAMKKIGLEYVSTPVSLMKGHQRIRLPREVIEQRSGNCIELTLLFASALEAAGLDPYLFLTENHAFLGVRFSGRYGKHTVEVEGKWILPVETTLVPNESFERAVMVAKESLMRSNGDIRMIDVKKVREQGVLPMDEWDY